MTKILVFLILMILAESLNTQLPTLSRTSLKYKDSSIINVTIGQKFSLPLTHFDSPFQNNNLRIYEVGRQQLYKMRSIQWQNQNNIVKAGTQLNMNLLPFECTLNNAKVSIKQEIKVEHEAYSSNNNAKWRVNQYVHLSFKSLLYILNVGSSELIAYLYNDVSIDKLTSYKLPELIEREEYYSNTATSSPVMAASTQEDSVYVFTSLGVWQIKTKTILTKVTKLQSISGFNSANFGGIDKILHGQNKIMIGLKKLDSIFVIPEPSSIDDQKMQFTQIKEFNNKTIFPQDIALKSNILYVLDYYSGIYVYSILKGKISERTLIPFQSFGGNSQFLVHQSSIFVNFNDIDGSKVVEISSDIQTDTHYLVRYIKSDDLINSLQIFSVLTSTQEASRDQQVERQFETFLFLVQNFQNIEIYPFNIDPRIIARSQNGVKLKGKDIRNIFYIKNDLFLLVTNEQIKYVKILVEKSAILCRAKKGQNPSASKYYHISLLSNISTCQNKNHSLVNKQFFNQYCELQTSYFLHIQDPDQSKFQKLLLYGLVIGVVVCFMTGLLCLIQWRNNKMMLLSRLKDEIIRFRNRHRKMQPFAQDNVEQKEIEIEMPDINFCPNQSE